MNNTEIKMESNRKRVNKKQVYFSIFRSLTESRLEEITESLNLIEGALKGKFEDWHNWYEEETAGCSDEEKSEFIDHYYDDLAMIRDTAPNMARQSMCVCLSGYFENFLADLCRFLYRYEPSFASPDKKLYLENSKTYLIDKAGLDKKLFDSEEWTFCVNASYVRNAIAHNGGRIPKKPTIFKKQVEEIRKFVGQTKGIEISGNQILIDTDYCELLLSNVRTNVESFLNTSEVFS